jgi:hypothetical protein
VNRWLAITIGAIASVPLVVLLSAPESARKVAADCDEVRSLIEQAPASLRRFWESGRGDGNNGKSDVDAETKEGRSILALAAAAVLPLFLSMGQDAASDDVASAVLAGATAAAAALPVGYTLLTATQQQNDSGRFLSPWSVGFPVFVRVEVIHLPTPPPNLYPNTNPKTYALADNPTPS